MDTARNSPIQRREFLAALLILALPFLLAKVCFWSYHAFPHNDDFLYARCSEILVNEGEYRHVSQQGRLAASVASHCVWGALFCLPLGFSYDALHTSVAVAAWLGAVAVWYTGRRLGGTPAASLLFALAMSIGPFYFGMSFTFMTDVTSAAFVALALAGYVCGILDQSDRALVAGASMATLAVWARQTHLLVVVVPLIAYPGLWWSARGGVTRLTMPFVLLRLTIAAGIPLLGYLLFESGWIVPGNASRMEIVDVATRDLQWIKQTLLFAYGGGLLLGLALIPVLLLMWRPRQENAARSIPWAGLLVAGMWLLPLAASGGRAYVTQATGYILYNAHLGPILLGDQFDPNVWSDMGGVRWPAFIWQLVTLLSIAALGSAAQRVFDAIRVSPGSPKTANESSDVMRVYWFRLGLLGMLVVITLALLWLVEMIYDRYWILCYPAMFALLASLGVEKAGRGRLAGTLFLIVVFFAGSFVFVHDFLAWNDARRTQVQRWMDEGLQPKDFDAGNGVNGWYRSSEDEQTFGRPGDDTPFWRGLATHMLAIKPREGWKVTGTLDWPSWAVWKNCQLYVLSRNSE